MARRRYTAADIGHIRLTGEAMIELAHKIVAERDARAKALGVPRGLEIPASQSPPLSKKSRPSSRSSRAWSLRPTRPASPAAWSRARVRGRRDGLLPRSVLLAPLRNP